MTTHDRAFGRYFEDFEVGDIYKHWPGKTITEYDDHRDHGARHHRGHGYHHHDRRALAAPSRARARSRIRGRARPPRLVGAGRGR